jgi:hypothetical protein
VEFGLTCPGSGRFDSPAACWRVRGRLSRAGASRPAYPQKQASPAFMRLTRFNLASAGMACGCCRRASRTYVDSLG